jgi:hypothetical protein
LNVQLAERREKVSENTPRFETNGETPGIWMDGNPHSRIKFDCVKALLKGGEMSCEKCDDRSRCILKRRNDF